MKIKSIDSNLFTSIQLSFILFLTSFYVFFLLYTILYSNIIKNIKIYHFFQILLSHHFHSLFIHFTKLIPFYSFSYSNIGNSLDKRKYTIRRISANSGKFPLSSPDFTFQVFVLFISRNHVSYYESSPPWTVICQECQLLCCFYSSCCC